jgi:indoleamine 2,3-dioxygenase
MNEGMELHLKTLQDMHQIMSKMWHESSPKGYLNFRTFIMGIQGNEDIFPNGVLYEGVSDIPFAFRGETGAQDSIIPSVDTAFGVDYPRNSLTEYLFQLRAYRPLNH